MQIGALAFAPKIQPGSSPGFFVFIEPLLHIPRNIGLACDPSLSGSGICTIGRGKFSRPYTKRRKPGLELTRRHSVIWWWSVWQGLASCFAMVEPARKPQRKADMVGRCYWGFGRSSVRCSWTWAAQSPGGRFLPLRRNQSHMAERVNTVS
jgi:hypothetical protein